MHLLLYRLDVNSRVQDLQASQITQQTQHLPSHITYRYTESITSAKDRAVWYTAHSTRAE